MTERKDGSQMRSTTGHDTRILASMRRTDASKGVIRVEDLYDTDIEDLWSALTVPERLSRWLAEVDGDLRLGGSFNVTFTSSWEGPGRIDVCEPPHRLLLTMNPDAPEETVIEALLSAEGAKTRLVIEDRAIALEELYEYAAGWQAHLEDLTAHLAGREPGPWHERWVELSPAYEALAKDL
jgi:uncharacterized protein YndB with AHSA1/START domain